MYDYPELRLASNDMRSADALYKPTSFWREATGWIEAELSTHGVENFRRLKTTLGYFVPTYGPPGNSLTTDQVSGLKAWLAQEAPNANKAQRVLDHLVEGNLAALSDYRVLLAADTNERTPRLDRFSESTFGAPVEQFHFDGRAFSRSSLNYLLGLAFLKKHLGNEPLRTVLEIGGGFGTLGEILATSGLDDWRYIDLDIPPTSYIAERYLRSALGHDRVTGYAETRQHAIIDIETLTPASVLCSWQIERLQGPIDLFVNFISFQEMEPDVVQNYLNHVGRLETRWVLLRNIREGKPTRSSNHHVGVERPIRTEDYLAMMPGYNLVASNVLPFGHRTVDGFHSELLLLKRGS